jgi:hypothetical protein
MVAQNLMPDQLGPYRLLERIGEGGMGVVHLAHDRDGRPVAVKVLRPGVAGDPDARRRLSREFETMRRVRSPFVAEVIDADVTGDIPYVVTRYVAGRSLDQLVREDGPLRGRALEGLAWGLAEGLAAVHAAGVVHRDLKPANVVIAGGTPVLIDFGIAHAPDVTKITMTGMFMGTPGYLAPEVVEGQPSGPSADVHSWGSTLAFACTGRAPFGTGSYETIFYRIVGGKPDVTGVPAKLLPLVTAALSRDPATRPTAVQLSTECAGLDLSRPGQPADLAGTDLAGTDPAGVGLAGGSAAVAGAAMGAAAAAGLAGADRIAGPPPGTLRENIVGQGAGPPRGGPARGGPALGGAGSLNPASYADLLPPVQYQPGGYGRGPSNGAVAPAPGQPGRGAQPGQYGQPGQGAQPGPNGQPLSGRAAADQPLAGVRGLLSGFGMLIAVAFSVLLPLAGTAVSVLAIMLLRATYRASEELARRRSARGARLSDVPVMVLRSPWALVRSALSTVLLAPLALACAGVAAAIALIAVPSDSLQGAGAYAAGAFVACYGFGPGSRIPRKQLGRFFGVTTRSRFAAALTTIVVVVIAVGVAAAAITQPHHLWPLANLHWNLQGMRDLAGHVQDRLRGLW